MEIKNRYHRNGMTVTPQETQQLMEKSVCVVGCGGLGGGIIENLVRIGVGRITAVDGDVFEETNLNRQILSNEENLGKNKAEEAVRQMAVINSDVHITAVPAFLKAENASGIIAGHDVVVDALDSPSARKLLEQECQKVGIPLVHGAIAGWSGQVAVVMPGAGILAEIYGDTADRGDETESGNPSFTPAAVSAIQACETVKLLLGKEGVLKNKMLMLDLQHHDYEIIDFGE